MPAISNLARLHSFWGVGLLVALLVSLPWLPIGSPAVAAREAPGAVSSDAISLWQPRVHPSERFTFYLVSTPEAARDQAAQIDPRVGAVFLIRNPLDEAYFARQVLAINEAREASGLFDVGIVDLR